MYSFQCKNLVFWKALFWQFSRFLRYSVSGVFCTAKLSMRYSNFGRSKNKVWLLPGYYQTTTMQLFRQQTLHKRSRILKRHQVVASGGRQQKAFSCCCCCCCCLLLRKRSTNIVLHTLLLKMQQGMNFNVNSNPDFQFCLTGLQILSLRFSKCRFVCNLNRYFWETITLFHNYRHETNFLTKELI